MRFQPTMLVTKKPSNWVNNLFHTGYTFDKKGLSAAVDGLFLFSEFGEGELKVNGYLLIGVSEWRIGGGKC
jgi:hypothetical protein